MIAKIAGGGMSAVYLGRRVEADPGAGQRFGVTGLGPGGEQEIPQVVALKIARHDVRMDERMLQMFLEEGKLIARLVHPNIVRTLEVGADAEQDFIAMELMLGKTFAAIQDSVAARDVRLSPDIAAWAAARVADALHYAHELTDENGRPLALVHRDVNPANVFATFAGEVKLFDFGLAKVTAGDVSGSNLIAGKLSYLSPEQIMQMPLDRRSDIFSLGTTLWELLTGKRLFRRPSDLDTVRAVQLGPIPDPRTIAPEIPEELARITKTALERNREHRYPNAALLARDLDAFVLTRTSPADVTARLAQLVDTLFPGEQKRQAGWLKPAISASRQMPAVDPRLPAGPVSRMPPEPARSSPSTSGRPPPMRRPSPPPRSLTPKETTQVMPHAPTRVPHDRTSSSPVLPAPPPTTPSSVPSMPASRPTSPGSSPSMPISSPAISAPPDTLPHMFEMTPRDGTPSVDPVEPLSFGPRDPAPIGPVTPLDGTPALHHRSAAPPSLPPSMPPSQPRSTRPSMPPVSSAPRTSWPIPSSRSGPPSVPPPPQRSRAPASFRDPPREPPRRGASMPPSIPPSIPPPPPSQPTELSVMPPGPASRTDIQAMPDIPAGPASRTMIQAMPSFPIEDEPAPLPREPEPAKSLPRPEKTPSMAPPGPSPTGRPGSLWPKRPPVPLPSRLKAGDKPGSTAAKKPAPAPAAPTTKAKTTAPRPGARHSEPPDSDTKIDMPGPPPGKRS